MILTWIWTSELKTTHDVGSVILAILLYKEYIDSAKPAAKRAMGKQTGSDSTGRRDSGTTSDNISTGKKRVESRYDFQMIYHLHSVTEGLHYVTVCKHSVTECK